METKFKEGDNVIVQDYSEAHGDLGKIWKIQANGIVLIDLGECIWPVYSEEEFARFEPMVWKDIK